MYAVIVCSPEPSATNCTVAFPAVVAFQEKIESEYVDLQNVKKQIKVAFQEKIESLFGIVVYV